MYDETNDDLGFTKFIIKCIAAGILILLLVITFFWSFTTIGTGKVGVVTNYGRVTGRELTEGVAWITPWTESVTEYDIKTQKKDVPNIAAATKDLQDVNGTLVLNFQLARGEVSKMHQTVGADYDGKLITPALQEVFKASTAKYNASELITNRAEVKKDIYEGLKGRLGKYGITVQDVSITNFSFSAAFNQAIEAVQIANQEVAKARQQLEQAKIDAEKKIAEAQGAAEAQRLQQQTLTRELLDKQWIEKWDGKLPTYTGSGANFYIPTR